MTEDKIVIYMNDSLGKRWSRGKYAAHAVHAALEAFGVHPGLPVVVLGSKPRAIKRMRVFIRDEGRTELEPGTLTAGTDYNPPSSRPQICNDPDCHFDREHPEHD